MTTPELFPVQDLGRLAYRAAYAVQQAQLERQLALRDEPGNHQLGTILCVEHDPVITVSRRAETSNHLLVNADTLAQMCVQVEPTDRGGDITYHGPGQLVVYPILDLNALRLGLHDYMRLLEQSVLDTLTSFGVTAQRDPGATGVWVRIEPSTHRAADPHDTTKPLAKVCAFGVRVRKWISMHGLALNVAPSMHHFSLIVPCGLHGRPVTSLHQLLSDPPTFEQTKSRLSGTLQRLLTERAHAVAAHAVHPTQHPEPHTQK